MTENKLLEVEMESFKRQAEYAQKDYLTAMKTNKLLTEEIARLQLEYKRLAWISKNMAQALKSTFLDASTKPENAQDARNILKGIKDRLIPWQNTLKQVEGVEPLPTGFGEAMVRVVDAAKPSPNPPPQQGY